MTLTAPLSVAHGDPSHVLAGMTPLAGQQRSIPRGPGEGELAGQRGLARVGTVGLAGIEPATSPLSGLSEVEASAPVKAPEPDYLRPWSRARPASRGTRAPGW